MTPDRWRQIERIYEAALACAPAVRAAYLAEACADDAALRGEVEALLANTASAEHFIEEPAVAAAGAFAGLSGLAAGHRLGPYQIVAKLGAGGMGEVYRAHDTQLGREVAIKIVSPIFASDPQRLARFEREARVLASLNHPHIATIHGVEPFQSSRALVMELVEGVTLAQRIAGGALPLAEALAVARQLAEALEAAHEKGIVHRDLKPANVKITTHGVVKVLDFGLAKAVGPAEAGHYIPGLSVDDVRGVQLQPDLTNSPTLARRDTREGVLLGTAAYMSPEQARGLVVDRRADIWAFGCVLYEMLMGSVAFPGATITDVLAHVIERDPDWTRIPASTPAAIRRLLRRCLEKDPRQRLQAIGDARIEVVEALTRSDSEPASMPVSPGSRAKRLAAIAAVGGVTALVAGITTWVLKPSPDVAEPLIARSVLAVEPFDRRPPAPAGQTRPPLIQPPRTAIALSPDGRTLVFSAFRGTGLGTQLFLRRLDGLDSTPIPGTDRASSPFFSPDGMSVAFWADGVIRRVPLDGGPPSTVTQVPGSRRNQQIFGASWGDADVIVFATSQGLWRVKGTGGVPEAVTQRAADEIAHKLPYVLPGGQAVLFTSQKVQFRWDDTQIVVRSFVTGEQKVLLADGADARYLPSGHIVFLRRGTLMAAPFELSRLEVTAPPVVMIDGIMQAINRRNDVEDSGAGQFTVTAQGRLVYVPGGIPPDPESALVWVDRTGVVESLPAPRGEYFSPRLAPDDRRAVVFTLPSASVGGERVWTYDLVRRSLGPLSSEAERSGWGVWSPDGARVVYESRSAGRASLSLRAADGTGNPERVTMGGEMQVPSSWARSGQIAFVEDSPTTDYDIWVLDLNLPARPARPFIHTPAIEICPEFSPDGRWLAYTSNESGRLEIYVQPYPGPGPRTLVSTDGGHSPAWRGDGRELYYLSGNGPIAMNAVSIETAGTDFSVGVPRRLFQGRFAGGGPSRGYDVTADGRRFLMVQVIPAPSPPPAQLMLVENWVEELRRRVPLR